MDLHALREKLIPIAYQLSCLNYRPDIILLFGSRAKGTYTEQSDYDLAFVSKDFGVDRIKEGALLARLLFQKIPNADPIPVNLSDFLSLEPESPIIDEIKKHSVTLL